ncbi:BON domain-containing protein [Ramlibacter tataouinensis]|uniref:BON domain-containing protein n=1 Tax=Ramlibacter tataouinensis (strain ATCC BAA-407 / DSM 14655 / LMG 21543 / TTB310) TaxID=365046 RepID=F5Y4G2_RAMTT|nr:BON domain-containing protein [Ramlibacter tataouinensis]AEG93809.1 Hypothetical protein Rta_27070 [Ramlibacter tataouinensis TTB310]
MKMMSFLAGAVFGALLNQYLGSRASQAPRGAGVGARGTDELMSRDLPDWPTHAPPKTDDELRERIRSRVDRTLHNPQALQVEVSGGRVTLRGEVQARDVILLMAELESTTGVTSVDNQAQIQGSPDEIAPPQGQPAVRAAERVSSHMS